MVTRTWGAVIALAGVNALLWWVVAVGAPIKGNDPSPSTTPALMPYPDPSRGGVGTWKPLP